jgi:hypothetical protein
MLSGGGPDPWWAEGRVGLQIRVLGGIIKCTKSISVRVGEQCIPAFNDPFGGVPLIADISPIPGSNDISQASDVNIVFALPMNQITEIPSIDAQGNTYISYIEPSYENLKWKKQNGTEIAHEAIMRKAGKRLDLEPEKNLLVNKEYTVEMRLIAYEYPLGPGSIPKRVIGDDGQVWYQDTVFTFTTGLTEDLTDYIETSIPIRNQKYFLQDEVDNHMDRVQFNTNVGASQYFPEEDDMYIYSYYVRYIPEEGESIDVSIANPGTTDGIFWPIPNLENSTMYAVQFIQHKEGKGIYGFLQNTINGNLIQHFSLNTSESSSAEYDLESETELTLAETDVLPELSIEENAMFTYFFKTSEFNTLSEKLAGATSGESWLWWTNELTLNTSENFDKFDILGEKDEDNVKVQSSLINIYDPMEKQSRASFTTGFQSFLPYTNYYQERVDDEVWKFINQVNKHVDDHPTVNYQGMNIVVQVDLPSLNLDYAPSMDNRLTQEVMNYDDPLDDNDISNFGGMSFILGDYSGFINSGTIWATSGLNNMVLHFKTFPDVAEDATSLYEFGLDLESNPVYKDWIDTHYPNFYIQHSALQIAPATIGYNFYLDFYHSKFKDQTNSEKGYSLKELTWECKF